MLKKLLKHWLHSKLKGHHGSHYRPHSSDDYHKSHYGHPHDAHNMRGHTYYRKKRSSSSYSS